MKTSLLGLMTLGLSIAALVPACEPAEPDPPTIEGKSSEEAAEITAELACDYVSRCGIMEVSCADCAEGESCGGCTVERYEVAPDACIDDLLPDLEVGFGCETLSEDDQAVVDECLAALPGAECPSIEAVEDWVNGGGGDDPRSALEACELVEDIRYRCYDHSQTDASPGAPAMPTPG